ncbi:glycosyl transferase family 4 [Pseudopedobacter beijingensis]|uniref:Glycosyl transferase family 4 n=1 Tax=Pseudopedobacter beijingensis TaxID=1207056 RepID=A0ABW4IBN1_9SPHI
MLFLFFAYFILFFLLEKIYFKIADRYNIIDKPNLRSSHTEVTLRGGGIIFPIAIIIGILYYQPDLWLVALSIFSISLISFLDDILTLSNKLRLGVHFVSLAMIVFECFASYTNSWELRDIILLTVTFIIGIGIINAYNFMDGINGITVVYSFITLLGIYFVQEEKGLLLLEKSVYVVVFSALVVFGFFNIRKKAKTFSGDVGSIAMALFLSFLILKLIVLTHDLRWILLLGIYGIDSVATIFCRLLRKENIFEAHRSHFYQYLANETKLSHIQVSVMYAFTQAILTLLLLQDNVLYALTFFLFLIAVYIYIRIKLEGLSRLFSKY